MATAPVTYAPKDYKSDLKPIWCAGCGDFGVLNALDERANKLISTAHRRAQAARFTWSATVESTAAVYRRLLS